MVGVESSTRRMILEGGEGGWMTGGAGGAATSRTRGRGVSGRAMHRTEAEAAEAAEVTGEDEATGLMLKTLAVEAGAEAEEAGGEEAIVAAGCC